jgi:hypothetical protein
MDYANQNTHSSIEPLTFVNVRPCEDGIVPDHGSYVSARAALRLGSIGMAGPF